MIGEEVRRRRKELGLTGAQLAERAGLAPSAVSQIETGRRTPSSASVLKIAEGLGVGVGELYPKVQPRLPLETDGVSVGLDAIERKAAAWGEELPGAVEERIHGIYQDTSDLIHLLMPNGWNPPIDPDGPLDNIELASARLQAMEPNDKERLWRTYVALVNVQRKAERMIWGSNDA